MIAIENAQSGFVWETIGQNTQIGQALERIFGDLDYGNAPDTYGTTLASPFAGGARHETIGPQLGTLRDNERDAPLQLDGLGDDTTADADEDGLAVVATMVATAARNTIATVIVSASEAAMLDAWIDFNGNGVFDHPSEHLARGTSIALSAGPNVLSFAAPAGATPGESFARYRISTTGGLLPTGPADDGEVEDYAVTILDGDAVGGAPAEIAWPLSGELNVIADGDEVVVQSNTIELFRPPGDSLGSLRLFRGTNGADKLSIANLDAVFDRLIGGDAGGGNDTLSLTGTGRSRSDEHRGHRHSRAGNDRHHRRWRQHADPRL